MRNWKQHQYPLEKQVTSKLFELYKSSCFYILRLMDLLYISISFIYSFCNVCMYYKKVTTQTQISSTLIE